MLFEIIGVLVPVHFVGVVVHLAVDKFHHRLKNAWHDHFGGLLVALFLEATHLRIDKWVVHGKCHQGMNSAAGRLAFGHFYPILLRCLCVKERRRGWLSRSIVISNHNYYDKASIPLPFV